MGSRSTIIRAVVIAGVSLLLLTCCIGFFTNSALTHAAPCDSQRYYRVNYVQCDNESDSYAPWYWFYHRNYSTYVNDNMDSPLYHPVGWYTSPTFYTTRYYTSGNGGVRIDNYKVGSSTARARFGGGGRSSGGNGRFSGGGRGNGSSSGHSSSSSSGHSSGGGHFGGGGHGKP